MTADEKQLVDDVVECEGFDYAFRYYSDFAEVDDAEFHRLRLAYVEAAEELEKYFKG